MEQDECQIVNAPDRLEMTAVVLALTWKSAPHPTPELQL